MRILIYGINFTPELVGNGKYTGEMAQWLAQRGHEVRVVVAPPFNPAGRVFDGYSSWKYSMEMGSTTNGGSLRVLRCPLWVSRSRSAVNRILHLASFAISSLPIMMAQAIWRPEIVMVIEPTALCVPGGLVTSWLSGARCWRHIQDFEVDAGFATGMLNSRMMRVIIGGLDKKSLTVFDRVSTISPKMMDRLHQKGFPPERSVMFPNWVDTRRIFPASVPSPLREQLGIARDSIVALHSGTMGRKQGLEILAEAAERLTTNKQLHFVFCGDGTHREELARRSAHLANIHWLPLQPLERLNDLLNLADIHLLPQVAGVADLMMPSKLTGMLASGRPLVTTAEAGTQLALAVQDCGLRVPTHDGKAFAEAINRLAEDAVLRARLGENARRRAEETLDKEKILSAFEQECLEVVGADPGPESRPDPKNRARVDAGWKSSVDISS